MKRAFMFVPVLSIFGGVLLLVRPAVGQEPSSARGASPPASTPELPRFRYANTWDLNFEGGAGYTFGGVGKWSGLGRIRAGALIVRNDNFYQVGAIAEYLSVLGRPAFGLQAEYLHLQFGTWVQVGGSIDTKGRPGAMAAIGLSVFGIEAQIREFDQDPNPTFALIGKIRLPLGIFVYGLRTHK